VPATRLRGALATGGASGAGRDRAGQAVLGEPSRFVGLPGLAMGGTVLFAVAAVGGVAMNLGYHWRRLPLPMGLMIGHAVLAVLGYLLLLIATCRG